MGIKFQKFSFVFFILISTLFQSGYAFNSYQYKTKKPEVHIFANQNATMLRQQSSQLANLARQVKYKGQKARFLFASIVLDELILLHQTEARKAKIQAMENLRERDKLHRWSQKTLSFSNRLEQVKQRLNLLSDIQWYEEGFGELSFVIDGRPILVNSPSIRQQAEMEERIVLTLCASIRCDQKQLEEFYQRNEHRVFVAARWNLEENGDTRYQTKSGLHFVFNGLDNKVEKERISRMVARDLNLIAESLVLVHKQGFFIDWEYLYLNSEGGSEQSHQLVINQFRDSISLELVAIPYLNDYPQKVIPWLQARIKKETAQHYIHDAEALVGELSNVL